MIMNEAVIVRVLGRDEASLLDHVLPDIFDHDIDARWCTEFFADPRHHLAVALLAGAIIGMASAVHCVHPDKPPELWINEVGVAPTYQGQGVGSRLMQALFVHARALGCDHAWVLTEESNAAGLALACKAISAPTSSPSGGKVRAEAEEKSSRNKRGFITAFFALFWPH